LTQISAFINARSIVIVFSIDFFTVAGDFYFDRFLSLAVQIIHP
tara:strand:- start:356955 stop:357086 length:132 start_codon:yes stop_codon:yes gene_type:complete